MDCYCFWLKQPHSTCSEVPDQFAFHHTFPQESVCWYARNCERACRLWTCSRKSRRMFLVQIQHKHRGWSQCHMIISSNCPTDKAVEEFSCWKPQGGVGCTIILLLTGRNVNHPCYHEHVDWLFGLAGYREETW